MMLAVQSCLQKYFSFASTQIKTIYSAVPFPLEGRTRRHERWVRDAMDVGCVKRRMTLLADGEVVWS